MSDSPEQDQPEVLLKPFNPEFLASLEIMAMQTSQTGETDTASLLKTALLTQLYGLSQGDALTAQEILEHALSQSDSVHTPQGVERYFEIIKERASGFEFDPGKAAAAKLKVIEATSGEFDIFEATPVLADYYAIVFDLEPKTLETAAKAKARALDCLQGIEAGKNWNWGYIRQKFVEFYTELQIAVEKSPVAF